MATDAESIQSEAAVCLTDSRRLFQAGHFHEAYHKLNTLCTDNDKNLKETLLMSNNRSICGYMKLLSNNNEKILSTQKKCYEDHLKINLNKVKSVPVSQNLICTEILVLFNYVFIKVLTRIDIPTDDRHIDDLILKTLKRVSQSICKRSKINRTSDVLTLLTDIFNMLTRIKLFDTDRILNCLVNLCCVRSIWLFWAGRIEEAISCLTLCRTKDIITEINTEALPLIFPLSLLLNGGIEVNSDIGLGDQVNLLLGLMYYKSNDHVKCVECLSCVQYRPWLPFSKYLMGYIHYKEEKYSDCMLMLKQKKDNSDETIGYTDNDCESMNEECTLGHDAARIQALSNNLSALCLSTMNKSYCAIQRYKEALQIDFTYLQPLYNISLEYRKMCLYDAELESLNLMTIALENQKEESMVKGDNSLVTMVLRDTGDSFTYIQLVYVFANRCLQLKKYDVASQKYMDLLKLLNNSYHIKVEENHDVRVPPVHRIYIETIQSLLKAKKFEDCIVICDRFTTCNSTTDTQKIIHHRNSADRNQIPDSQNDIHSQSSVDSTGDRDDIVSSSSRKRRRLSSDIRNEERGFGFDGGNCLNDHIVTLLYKSQALVHLGKLSKAVKCLESVTDILQCRPSIQKNSENGRNSDEPKLKRQRISSDRLSVSMETDIVQNDDDDDEFTDIQTLASQVYGHMGAALAVQKNYHDALHFLRISLQLNNDSLTTLFNHTNVLWSCDHHRDAVIGWCSARDIETKSDSFQLANVLKQKQNTLRSLIDTDKDIQLGDILTDHEITQSHLVKLDILCLQFIMKMKQKSAIKW